MLPTIPIYNSCLAEGCLNTEPLLAPVDLQRIVVSDIFHLAENDLSQMLNRTLPPLAADLLELGIGVLLFDGLSARYPNEEKRRGRRNQYWQRDMNMIVPVRQLEHWQQVSVRRHLHRALEFVSGDYRWDITFVHHCGPARLAEERRYLEIESPHRICLRSEGIDSTAGLANRMAEYPNEQFLAVSALIQTQCKPMLSKNAQILNTQYRHRLKCLPVQMHRINANQKNKKDRYDRARSFLLLLLGAVAAIALDINEVEVYENGLECFNLPLDADALPAQESRMMHPIFLYRMSQFLTALSGKPFRFLAPDIFQTKSDMLKRLDTVHRPEMWSNTISCMRFPRRKRGGRRGGRHCGCCPGCVLRRLAFNFSGFIDPDDDYQAKASEQRCVERRINYLTDFDRMRGQVNRLQWAFEHGNHWESFLECSGVEVELWDEFETAISQVGGVSLSKVRPEVENLFLRYIREWEAIYGLAA